jgi:hypothetical protein
MATISAAGVHRRDRHLAVTISLQLSRAETVNEKSMEKHLIRSRPKSKCSPWKIHVTVTGRRRELCTAVGAAEVSPMNTNKTYFV